MYLLDTNVVFEARRGTSRAVRWLRSVDPPAVYLSVITPGEIMRGIARKQRVDPGGAAPVAEWLQKIRHEHSDRILGITDQVADEWGRIAAMRPRGVGLIAATAVVHGLIIVTRNVFFDFNDVQASIINPWNAND